MQIIKDKTKKIIKKAGSELNNLFLQNKDKSILFLSSGGSAFKLLEFIDAEFLSEKVTISVLDERYSRDPLMNNFVQLKETEFYRKSLDKKCHYIETIPKDAETLEVMALRFEIELKKWRENNPEGVVIATLGMGPDGHTSGVMPYPENNYEFKSLFEGSHWVRGYDAGDKNKYNLRVTTTLTFLKTQIDYGVVIITGEEKIEALEKVLAKSLKLSEVPALVFWQMKNVVLLTDIN